MVKLVKLAKRTEQIEHFYISLWMVLRFSVTFIQLGKQSTGGLALKNCFHIIKRCKSGGSKDNFTYSSCAFNMSDSWDVIHYINQLYKSVGMKYGNTLIFQHLHRQIIFRRLIWYSTQYTFFPGVSAVCRCYTHTNTQTINAWYLCQWETEGVAVRFKKIRSW